MIITEASWDDDYWNLVYMAQEFLAESHQSHLTWDQDKAKAYIWAQLYDSHTKVFVATNDDEEAMGYAVLHVREELTVEPLAYITSFFVRRTHRGGSVGSRLLKHCQKCAIDEGAAILYAASTAGIDDDGETLRSFKRLFEASGMTYLGDFFRQDLR